MNPGQNTEAFNQEIADLEAKLAAKKQELVRAGVESPEKAVFNQVVREHVAISEHTNSAVPVTPIPVAASQGTRKPTTQEEQRINVFIAHALTKGLGAAVAEAKKTGDPFFIDLLHDRLADEYYQKLLAARKVNPT